MRIDLRFVELERELQIQRDYIQMLADHMPDILEAERKRLHALYDGSSEEERAGLDFLEHELDQGIVTRSFALASVVGLWAIYESSVSSVAEVGRKSRALRLRMDDLKGNFLERARRYFDEVLRLELHPDGPDLSVLHDLAVVRNIFAHTSGRVGQLLPEKLKKVGELAKRNPGMSIVDDVLIANADAAHRFQDSVERLLLDLFTRARSTFTSSVGGTR